MSARRDLLRFEVPLGLLGATLVSLSFVFNATGVPRWIPPAPMVRAGIPSPLTGMTRSFLAMARGDLALAFDCHPLGPLCFAACILMASYSVLSFATGRRWKGVIAGTRGFGWGVAGAFAVAWVRQIKEVGI